MTQVQCKTIGICSLLVLSAGCANVDKSAVSSVQIPPAGSQNRNQAYSYNASSNQCIDADGASGLNKNTVGPCTEFSNMDLTGTDLSGKDLSGSNFSYAKLINVNFSGSNLEGANFDYADVTNANFSNANLNNAKLVNTNFDQRAGANVSASPTPAPSPTTPVVAYAGCYVDTGVRALPNQLIGSGATVESCVAAAQAGGYAYAGVQYGGQCFAGNTLGFTVADAGDCNMACDANSNETCGGSWRNSIYATGVGTPAPAPTPAPLPAGSSYVGCYVDTSTRALPNQLIGSGATVEGCIAAAQSGGFAYAGVQYGGQCFAGNTLGFAAAAAGDCNMGCDSNPSETCGGSWRNGVYLTGVGTPVASPTPAPLPAGASYVGCYVDASTRALPNQLIDSGATVEGCLEAARSSGYAYAGVQYGGQCFAGNTLGFTAADAGDCNMACSSNSSETCGGTWRNSVYLTGVGTPVAAPTPGPLPAGASYVGCYVDTSDRALPNQLIGSSATVESCVSAAQSAGYAYAGVQYGGQCFAGNTLGFTAAASGDCNMACASNSSETCGGTWRNSVYATGVGGGN